MRLEVQSSQPRWRSVQSVQSVQSLRRVRLIVDFIMPGGASGKKPTRQCRRLKDGHLISGLAESPGEGNHSPLPCYCLGTHGQRTVSGYSPWGLRESDMTEVT